MRHLFLALPLCLIACADAKSDDDDDDDGWGGPVLDTGGSSDDSGSDLDGGALFQSQCAACHGSGGNGTGSGADLTARVPELSDAELLDVIENGTEGMPDLGLTPSEVSAVFEYLRDTFGEEGGG